MNEQTIKLAEQFVSSTYIKSAIEARNQRENLIKTLLATVLFFFFFFNRIHTNLFVQTNFQQSVY
jgi:hypothetical protein